VNKKVEFTEQKSKKGEKVEKADFKLFKIAHNCVKRF